MSYTIIGIHGLSNKPTPNVLAESWEKAMLEGLRKNKGLIEKSINFQSVYWADVMYDKPDENYDLYKSAKKGAIKRYKEKWIDIVRAAAGDAIGDVFDGIKKTFGFDAIADKVLKYKLKDLHSYYTNETKRIKLRERFSKAICENKNKRIMVVAHSMGSIIVYDVLREIGREDPLISIEHFVTIGSPLGIPHVKYKISKENALIRTPSVVKRWTNLADRRDPVAVDIYLKGDYEPNDSGVEVKDDLVMNDWGGICHKSYGYLRTPEFTDILHPFI